MTELNIPFAEKFIQHILSGQKTVTSRSKQYGFAGDHFVIEGKRFEVLKVTKMPLGVVYNHLWKESGAVDCFDFIVTYNRLHPGKPYDPYREVYVHFFREVAA